MKNRFQTACFGLFVALFCAAATTWASSDLIISSITLSSYSVYPGDDISIDSLTKNIGADDTGWWKYLDVFYYFGTASNKRMTKIGEGMTPNANEPNGISVDEEEEDTISSYTIPAGTAPGTYYITCVADANGEVGESNESNNQKSVAFTVKGIPSFSNVQWRDPRYVSSNDTVVAYGKCVNIPAGSTVTIQIYEDDLDVLSDELIATLTAKVVKATDGTFYFARKWAAAYMDDASGDPEFYFTVTYSTAEASSGEGSGELLNVSNDRMQPSPDKGDFYYDPANVAAGAATANATLTDDRIPLILIHGMSGDAKPDTLNYWYGWVNSDTNATLGYFNQSPMKSMFRVYRYVYDSRDFISTNAVKLATFVNHFYSTHPEFADRQVVLMAHSMGGLVSRYAMNVNTQFASRVHRLVTLGSPHLGSQGANPTWIKYSGPDDNSWFISGIYNTFGLHNNTAGCFDLAWYATNQIPAEALTESSITAMADTYNVALLRQSLKKPFCGWAGMLSTAADPKLVLFGGSATNQITDTLREDWPDAPSSEVKTDHLGLWVATKIFRSMSYANGKGVGDNDGLVPLNSALLTDANAHPNAVKLNLNDLEGQEVDHASYLDVPVTMDSVRTRLLTIIRGYCAPTAVANTARWRLIDSASDTVGAWQKSGVRLPALTPGKTYMIEFKDVDGYTTPANITFTAKEAVSMIATGTYTVEAAPANHAPSMLALSGVGVTENSPVGTLVGTLSTTDADSNDTFTYSLVSGDGDTGNACFSISGNQLLTAQVFDYETAPAHYCRIRSTDAAGLYTESAFTVDVTDVDESTPGEASGDAWVLLEWDAVAGATSYRVDISACDGTTTYAVPAAPLGTNTFTTGQRWRYNTPAIAAGTVGAIRTAPCFAAYGTTNAHFLVGTNGMAIQSDEMALHGASAVTVAFTHGAWNGGGQTNRTRVDVSYRLDGGAWTALGTSYSTSSADGGEVAFSATLDAPAGDTIEIQIAAPNACISNGYLRGAYVYNASATLFGVGEFSDDCRVAGSPVTVTGTTYCVTGLPADADYYYRVEALVNDIWQEVAGGHALSTDYLAPPENLGVVDTNSTEFVAQWKDSLVAERFELQVTEITSAGIPETLATVPNVNLSSSGNTTDWTYSAFHAAVNSNWLCIQTTTNSDYHGLVMACEPGIMSPVMDLSGYASGALVFTMRSRGVANNVESLPVTVYYSTDGGSTWMAGESITTNQVGIYNNRYIQLPVPAAAFTAHARIELRCDDADSRTSIWSGNGVGIRNLSFIATPKAIPDYSAYTVRAVTNIESHVTPASVATASSKAAARDVPIVEADVNALVPETHYYFRVRSVDAYGNVSAWTNADVTTLPEAFNSAPYGLDLSGSRTIAENNAAGTVVGTLSATDDEGDALTYELIAGDGSADNDLFVVNGDSVVAASVFNYEIKTNRSFRIRVSDPAGLFSEATFEILILDDTTETPDVQPMSEFVRGITNNPVTMHAEAHSADDIQLNWSAETPADAYDLYGSTNLTEGFFFIRRIYTNVCTEDDFDGPVKFWYVKPVE